MFVGGGNRDCTEGQTVFQYSISENTWTTLPQCPASHQGLTTLNGELVSVGGMVSQRATNIVYTFRDGEWKEDLPPMPTPRYLLSTVTHNNALIVAAGGVTGRARDGRELRTQAVEICIGYRPWYVVKQLPFPSYSASTCIIGDTCYILGGLGQVEHVHKTLHVSLSNLINQVVPGTSAPETKGEWNTLKTQYPLVASSIVELGGKLIAIGGSCDVVLRRGTRFISIYDFAADMWVECQGAQLPVPLYRPGVVKLPGNKVMIIGGQSEMKQFSNEAYIGSYELKTN